MLASAADRFPGLRRCSAGMQVDECRSMAHLDWDEFAASATQQYVCVEMMAMMQIDFTDEKGYRILYSNSI